MAAGGAPPSSVNIIVLLGIGATAILLLVIWVLSRLRSALPSHPVDAGRAYAASEERNDNAEGALVALSAASESSEEKTEPSIDQDDLVKQLAKSLGVQDPLTPLPAEVSSDGDGGQPAIEAEQPEQAQAATSDAGGLETLPVESPSSSPRQMTRGIEVDRPSHPQCRRNGRDQVGRSRKSSAAAGKSRSIVTFNAVARQRPGGTGDTRRAFAIVAP